LEKYRPGTPKEFRFAVSQLESSKKQADEKSSKEAHGKPWAFYVMEGPLDASEFLVEHRWSRKF